MLDSFIVELEKDLKIEGSFASNLPGKYVIPISDDLGIIVSKVDGGFSFFCNLAVIPKEKEEEAYLDILSGNLLGQRTHNAIIALDETGNNLTLYKVIDYHIEYKEFKELLEDFMNTAELWRDQILNSI